MVELELLAKRRPFHVPQSDGQQASTPQSNSEFVVTVGGVSRTTEDHLRGFREAATANAMLSRAQSCTEARCRLGMEILQAF